MWYTFVVAQVVRKASGVLQYDPFIRDFVVYSNGSSPEIHPVDQRVAILLGLPRGTMLSDVEVGNPIRDIKRITNDVEEQVIDGVRLCLKELIDAGDVELLDIVVEKAKIPTSRLFVGVFYRNLRLFSQQQQKVEFSILWQTSPPI